MGFCLKAGLIAAALVVVLHAVATLAPRRGTHKGLRFTYVACAIDVVRQDDGEWTPLRTTIVAKERSDFPPFHEVDLVEWIPEEHRTLAEGASVRAFVQIRGIKWYTPSLRFIPSSFTERIEVVVFDAESKRDYELLASLTSDFEFRRSVVAGLRRSGADVSESLRHIIEVGDIGGDTTRDASVFWYHAKQEAQLSPVSAEFDRWAVQRGVVQAIVVLLLTTATSAILVGLLPPSSRSSISDIRCAS